MQTRAEGGAVMDEAPARDVTGPKHGRGRDDAAQAAADLHHDSGRGTNDSAEHSTGTPDRWRWRRRIRANPQQHFAYRVVIGVLGSVCIVAGVVTGPLPGPGGIPLVLLGLAIWASEFSWAHRLLGWFKRKVHQVRRLPRGRKALFWVCFLGCCALLGYASLLVVGAPRWLPSGLEAAMARLPGVRTQ